MSEIIALSAHDIAQQVNSRKLDRAEVMRAHLEALDNTSGLNFAITSCSDHIGRPAHHPSRSSRLAGVPVLIKDIFDTAGIRTTYGSSIFRGHVPRRTATAVTRLLEAGASVLGKANLHEFAWGTTSQNPHWGTVANPRFPGRVAGGSSGGNAAALAANISALGLGTDTGGSVRIPSACCYVIGYKPTHGRIPLRGCFPLAPSLDTVGLMARTVADCALAYSVLARESLSEHLVAGLVVGVLETAPPLSPSGTQYSVPSETSPRIGRFIAQLTELGARLEPITLPVPRVDLIPLFFGEAAITHARLFPSRGREYGSDVAQKLATAQLIPLEAVSAARQELRRWREETDALTSAFDLVVAPTLGCNIPHLPVWELDVREPMTAFTRLFNFLAWPALALADIQLAGRSDELLLSAASEWERAFGMSTLDIP